MRTRVRKWGNSLGLRIPKAFAAEVAVEDGSTVELSVADGELVVRPLAPSYSLDELLSKVESDQLHPETDFGPATGRESW